MHVCVSIYWIITNYQSIFNKCKSNMTPIWESPLALKGIFQRHRLQPRLVSHSKQDLAPPFLPCMGEISMVGGLRGGSEGSTAIGGLVLAINLPLVEETSIYPRKSEEKAINNAN